MTLPGGPILIYHDAGAGPAGTDRYVDALGQGLETQGCDVVRAGQEAGPGWARAAARFGRLRGLRRRVKPGVVHIHGVRGTIAPLLAALRGAGPIVLTVHGFGLSCPMGLGILPSGPEGEALAEGLRRSSVVVFPSTVKESCPPLLLEAMAHERPVVAGRSGGIPELVEDGENGWLVRPGDRDAMAKALLAVRFDGDRAQEMGERGRRRVRARFSQERHIREILEIYRELLWGR